MRRAISLLLTAVCSAACATAGPPDIEDDPEDPENPVAPTTCDGEPKYGDGTCHFDLACGIPDVDCFEVFSSDAAAREQLNATYWSQYYTLLPATDSHYAKARAQLDKSWELFKSKRSMDKLADKHLALILVSDSSINAFVAPSDKPGMAYWAVFFNTGTLDAGLTEDQMHGLIFHEMAHLVNHHTSAEVKVRTRKVYAAPASAPEPIGADMEKHAAAQAVLDEWFGHAAIAGAYSSTSLADLPFGGYGDWLLEEFINYIPYLPYPGSSCTSQAQTVLSLAHSGTYSDFDQSFTVSSSGTSTRLSVINTLKQCIGTTAYTFGSFRGYLEPYAPEVFAGYTTSDASKFDNLKAFDGLLALIGDRRAKMRALQTKFQDVTGQPWSAARYFSTEEEADDESARITAQTGLSQMGVSGIMMAAMGGDRARCVQALSSGERIPYGENLEDDHHGSCWRVMHAEQFADHVMNRSRRRPTEAKTAWVPTKVSTKPVY